MTSIRSFTYAALLVLSAFSGVPSQAQDASGKFTLNREVRWQNAMVPAGEYHFSLESRGPNELLILQKVDEHPAGFMLLVPETQEAMSSGPGRITITSRSGVRYVSAMDLPQVGMILRFTVPVEGEKQLALAHTTSPSSTR